MRDFFPAISQNIPKQEFNVFLNNPIFSQNFSSVGFPFCPQAGKIISHLGYFSCYFPKYPKWDFNDFLNNPIFSQYFLISRFPILSTNRDKFILGGILFLSFPNMTINRNSSMSQMIICSKNY
jgi:hypothetical protein